MFSDRIYTTKKKTTVLHTCTYLPTGISRMSADTVLQCRRKCEDMEALLSAIAIGMTVLMVKLKHRICWNISLPF